jgi:hypothetical protein
MKTFFSSRKVSIVTLVLLALPVTIIECAVLRRTGGAWMYPLDDTFIHMALAKNLAFHGVWGISPHEFASASSSVLYTIILAGLFRIFSVKVIIPFLVNCLTGLILLAVVQRWLIKEKVMGGVQMWVLLCLLFFTPLPILIVCGMEHTLQCLFSFLFVFGFAGWLEDKLAVKERKWTLPWVLPVYGMLVTSIRYEGMFLVGIVCLILAWHRQIRLAFRLGILSLLPLIVFGIYSVVKGSYFLPNSVLLKSDGFTPTISGIMHWLDNIFVQRLTMVRTDNIPAGTPRPGISLLATQRLLILLPLVWLAFYRYIRERISYGYILFILTGCTILQLCLASTGWLYRYEAYLVFCSVLIIGVLVVKYGAALVAERPVVVRWMAGIALFAILFPFFLRSSAAFTKTTTACQNIYQQQYEMGSFVHKYYDGDAVAANDIGAISFLGTGKTIDLWGLGNITVARSRKKGYWTAGFLDSLCRSNGVRTAVFYEKWFGDSLSQRWNKVATWQIRDNVIVGDDSVSFFSLDKRDVPVLKQNLMDYEKNLPAGVSVKYY